MPKTRRKDIKALLQKMLALLLENLYSLKEKQRVGKEEINKCLQSLQENFYLLKKKQKVEKEKLKQRLDK